MQPLPAAGVKSVEKEPRKKGFGLLQYTSDREDVRGC